MSIVGEAALSVFFQALFDKFTSPDLLKFMRQEKVHDELKKWEKMLLKIHAVLDDAEEKQMTSQFVKMWLEELRDVAYDAGDILDEFATEALRRKLNAAEPPDQPSPRPSKVRKLLNSAFTLPSPSSVTFNLKMGSKINEITERLDGLEKERIELGLKELAVASSSRVVRETSSVMPMAESQVYGRDEDKNKIVEKLLEVENDEYFSVIPIVGMGGVGKTTLAQFVYNDTKVKKHFDLKAWVCVSDDFDVKVITGKMLESVIGGSCDFKNLDVLQATLQQLLTNKKFLVVLDDIWSENYGDWKKLQAPLIGGALGSKVIVTTRIQKVAEMMGTVEPHFLKQLSKVECWSVFEQHAFKNGNVDRNPNMVAIGKKNVEKCKGLPLAARTLGGLLRSKQYETEWESILNSEIWDLTEEESDILPALRLSYYHLPSHLKQCFAYCSIFPKDYEFEEEEIVLLWMAQGFLQRSGEKKMEDWGKKYFEDLKSRSFFQPLNREKSWYELHEKSLYVMHDLINDLAQWVAGETCFRLEGGQHTKQYKDSKRVRHSSYVVDEYEGNKKFECFHEFQCLRTFLPLMLSSFDNCYFSYDVPLLLLPKLKCLRALSLSRYYIVELPNSIGDLKLLRYLDVSYTEIRRLPESISSLYNLETLRLENCPELRKLSEDFGNLINLHHLNNFNTNSLEEMPRQISKLTCLQTLPNFVVGKGNSSSSLKEIMPLSHLQGALCISRLENVVKVGDAGKANLIGKQDIRKLTLEWSGNFDDSRYGRIEFEVFNMLRPCTMLKELTIECYAGAKFPTWLGDSSFSNMVLLKIENCVKCTSLPPLGQLPLLKDLSIKRMDGVRSVGPEFYGKGCVKPFQSLEILCFENMQEWQDWIPYKVDYEEFSKLRKLSISRCPNLQGKLPNLLPSLEKIFITGCEQLVVSISNLPMLCDLNINGCKEVVHRSVDESSSLRNVFLSKISELKSLTEVEFMRGIGKAKYLTIDNCKELASVWQDKDGTLQQSTTPAHLAKDGCTRFNSSIESEQEEHQQLGVPCRLEILSLRNCESLEKLPQALHCLTSLGMLKIERCPRLISFPDTGLPLKLRELIVEYCESLEKLPHALHCLTSLEKLKIICCSRLSSFTDAGLPPMLRELMVAYCPALNSLHEAMMCNKTTFLERLQISGCESLTSIVKGQLPPNLKRLSIINSKNLQYVVDDGEDSSLTVYSEDIKSNDNASLLEDLYVSSCSAFKFFSSRSRGDFPTTLKDLRISYCSELTSLSLPTLLKSLTIRNCPKLESIVGDKLDNNSSLEILEIYNSEKLKSLPEGLHNLYHLNKMRVSSCSSLVSFPNGGLLPTNLRQLWIDDCERLEALPNLMYNLTSLPFMKIERCPSIVYFLEEGFPSSLIQLEISNLNIWKALLEWGLHRLTSLKYLTIKGGCPDLVSFPQEEDDDGKMMMMMLSTSLTSLTIGDFPNLEFLSSKGFQDLPALEHLSILNCPKLTSLPEKGMPLSLLRLEIYNCPLLKQHCEKDKGREWVKIAHIPCVDIDDPNEEEEEEEI